MLRKLSYIQLISMYNGCILISLDCLLFPLKSNLSVLIIIMNAQIMLRYIDVTV